MQKNISSILKVTIYLVVAFVVFAGFLSLMNKAFASNEVKDCLQWQGEAHDFDAQYYLTSWQADQCAYHNIIIDAVVR